MNSYCSYDRKIQLKTAEMGAVAWGPGGKGMGKAQVWLVMVGSVPGLEKGVL